MRTKLQGGPADGLTLEAAANVTEATLRIAVVERADTGPVTHHYYQRRRGGKPVVTFNGDPIYDWVVTLPREGGGPV